MFANDNEMRSAFDKLMVAHSLNAPTPLDEHLELYHEILGSLSEGKFSDFFEKYSGYEPSESMAKDWWDFYKAMYSACKHPRKHRGRHNAVIFMWATRATFRMESDR